MESRVIYDAPSDRFMVYLWHDADNRERVAYTRSSNGAMREQMIVPPGGELPVFEILTSDEWAAITDAVMADHPQLEIGLADVSGALDDAKRVRDRLLTLIEHTVMSGFGT